MEWLQLLFLFFANSGMILWMRAESRSDWRHMDAKLDANLQGIRQEMRDFHERLIKIEEARK